MKHLQKITASKTAKSVTVTGVLIVKQAMSNKKVNVSPVVSISLFHLENASPVQSIANRVYLKPNALIADITQCLIQVESVLPVLLTVLFASQILVVKSVNMDMN